MHLVFSLFFFTFGCQLASTIAFAAFPCPLVASRAVAKTTQKREPGGHLGPLVVPMLNFFSRSPLLSCFMVFPTLRGVLFSFFLSSDPAFCHPCRVQNLNKATPLTLRSRRAQGLNILSMFWVAGGKCTDTRHRKRLRVERGRGTHSDLTLPYLTLPYLTLNYLI